MKLSKYHIVSPLSVLTEIKNNGGRLSIPESVIIEQTLDNYYILDEHEPNDKSNIFARLSSPFYILLSCLMFIIVCPLKWLLTGKFYWSYTSKVAVFFEKWWSYM